MRPPSALAAALATATLAAAAAPPAAAQTIDTRNAAPLVTSTSLRFGQTFTVPAGANSLERFAFFLTLTGDGGGTAASFRTLVYAWDGARSVGPALFTSEARAPGCCSPVEEAFLTGGVPVVAGATYLALVEQLGGAVAHTRPSDGNDGLADTYAGGGAAVAACPPGTPLDACDWFAEAEDRSFVAQFATRAAVVPEPGTFALAGGALAAWAAVGRRRRAPATR